MNGGYQLGHLGTGGKRDTLPRRYLLQHLAVRRCCGRRIEHQRQPGRMSGRLVEPRDGLRSGGGGFVRTVRIESPMQGVNDFARWQCQTIRRRRRQQPRRIDRFQPFPGGTALERAMISRSRARVMLT